MVGSPHLFNFRVPSCPRLGSGSLWAPMDSALQQFVSWGCRSKEPSPGRLKMTEIYSVTVLETRSQRSGCGQHWILLGTLKGKLSQACLPVPGGYQ